MPRVVRDLQNGKPIQLSYRHKIIGTLQPVQLKAPSMRRGSAESVQNFLSTVDFGTMPKSLKDLDMNFKAQLAELRKR